MALSNIYAGQNKSPFSNALGNFMQARQTAQTQRLFAPAMSGDLSALNQLMSVNPDAGMKVQQVMGQQQQLRAQQEQQALENTRAAEQAKQDQIKTRMEALKAGIEYDPEAGTMTMQPKGVSFEGSGLTGQMLNLISQGERDPAIKQTPEYKLAVAQLSRAEMIPTEQGMITRPGIDIAQALGGKPSTGAAGGAGVVEGTEKTSPLQSEYNKRYQGMEGVNRVFNNYRQALEELGPQLSVGSINAKDQTRLASAYKALVVEAKTAAELGALSSGDLDIITGMVPDPTSVMGASKGAEALLGGTDELAKYLEGKAGAFESAYEGENIKRKQFTTLKKGQAKQSLPTKNKNGWALHTDAQGNKAYVGPNGEIEEVQ